MPTHIETLNRYLKEYKDDIYSIAESIASSFEFEAILMGDKKTRNYLFKFFPTIELFYIIDENCNKVTETYFNPYEKFKFRETEFDIEKNIAYRKFCKFIPNINDIYVEETVVLNPYSNNYVVNIFIPFFHNKKRYFLVIKLNFLKYLKIRQLEEVRWFVNTSKIMYGAISVILFVFSLAFLYEAVIKSYKEIMVAHGAGIDITIFKSVIYVTLALALLDLAKQIFQHEFLYAEDPTKHITLRKITSRFLSTILIAMAIETLLLVFKASILGTVSFTSVLFMAGSVAILLIGLSVYIYIGYITEKKS